MVMVYYNCSLYQGCRVEDDGEATRLDPGTEPEPEPVPPKRAERIRDHAGGGATGQSQQFIYSRASFQ